jgi:hypothetical protein
VGGFYDGEGVFKVRVMPATEGQWRYETLSNKPELAGKIGVFTCGKPAADNHGPVMVRNTYHLAYTDGSPYVQIGTTCYGWTQQSAAVQEQTLATLKNSPFNKIRFMSLNKLYKAGDMVPFAGTPPKDLDYARFNPAYFQNLEKRIGQLRDLGIEADVILFHPYDSSLGLDRMEPQADDRYLRYVVARLAAYRNVWWSMANEFDLMKAKTDADWDRMFQVVAASDPYQHLRSIHNCRRMYNYTHPWVTHASIQNGSAVEDFGRAILYREPLEKPIVFDEVKYEGDIEQRWGRLTGEQMVAAFWHGTIDGTYVGHSETLHTPEGLSWLANGGTLLGTSPPRLAFLKRILEAAPGGTVDPIDKWQDVHTAGTAGEFYLVYFGTETPAEWTFELPKAGLKAGMNFHVDILDTWNMTVSPVEAVFTIQADGNYRYRAQGSPKVKLPGKPYIALRITLAR